MGRKNSPSAKKELVTLITNYEEAKAEKPNNFIWMLTNWPTSPTGMPPNENLKKHKK